MRGTGPPARSGIGRQRAVLDALNSLSRHPDIKAREDYQPFSAQPWEAGRVLVTTTDPARFHALLRDVTSAGGFGPGEVFERLMDAEMMAMKADTKTANRTPAEVRRRLAKQVNPYLHLGTKPEDILNAFDQVLEIRLNDQS
ncbi:hypothetical protein BH23ACT9_BH23ACT9_35500 [soil metagenome]